MKSETKLLKKILKKNIWNYIKKIIQKKKLHKKSSFLGIFLFLDFLVNIFIIFLDSLTIR
jgi:hypothetical protein